MGTLPPIVKDGRPRLELQPCELLLADPADRLRAAGVALVADVLRLPLDRLAGSPLTQ